MQDNKLIAEFMGYKLTRCNRGQAWDRSTLSSIHDNYKLQGRLWVENDSYYKWDTSWDWLIPVVNKIEMECEGVPLQLIDVSFYDEIHEVYWAVIEFIKEHNNQDTDDEACDMLYGVDNNQ